MFLKNYTSGVPVSQTIYQIEQVLIRCGVKGITKEYAGVNGEIIAITFHLELANSTLNVRLPANQEQAQDAFWSDYCERHKTEWKRKKKRSDFKEQAARTAWKLARDWIEVEMSRIQLRQADVVEVFMPYIWDGKQTFFQSLKTSGFKGLLPEKT